MRVKAKISVDIPTGLFCKNCLRKEHDSKQQMFCTLYNRFLYIRKGDYLKCRECVNMLYDEIEKGE